MRMWMTKLLCDSLNRTLAKNCSIEKSLVFSVRLRNDLYCVEWGVKLYSLTHSFSQTVFNFFFTCMHKAQKTKLVHASTTASSSSAMLEQARLDTTRHDTTQVQCVERVEPCLFRHCGRRRSSSACVYKFHCLCFVRTRKEKEKRQQTVWVKDYLRKRETFGCYNSLLMSD